jgi:hypothetical protein
MKHGDNLATNAQRLQTDKFNNFSTAKYDLTFSDFSIKAFTIVTILQLIRSSLDQKRMTSI